MKKIAPPISASRPTPESMADRNLVTGAARGQKSPGERMWFPLEMPAGNVVAFVLAPSFTIARQLARRILREVSAAGLEVLGHTGPMLETSPDGRPGKPGPGPCSWWRYFGCDEGGRARFRRESAEYPAKLEGPATLERWACIGPRVR